MKKLEAKVIDSSIFERNAKVLTAFLSDLRQDIDIEGLEADRG